MLNEDFEEKRVYDDFTELADNLTFTQRLSAKF